MKTNKLKKLLEELVKTYDALGSEELKDRFGIRSKTDGQHIIFDYDMLNVDWYFQPAYLCRGLILDAHSLKPLCVPLVKFWNAGEARALPIDWNSAKVFEKVDGTMVKRWFSPYTNNFEYSTRYQLPCDIKSNIISDTGITWHQLIQRCLGELPLTLDQSPEETIVFEIMSPLNRVVVHQKDYRAALLARRNNFTLEEQDLSSHPLAPKVFHFNSTTEVIEFSKTLKGVEQEGFVVVDKNFCRVKVKGEEYVRLHHLKDSSANSLKSLVLVIKNGEYEEVGNYFPEYIPAMKKIGRVIEALVSQHEEAYEKYKTIPEQKDFALVIQSLRLPNPGLLFAVRKGNFENIRQAIDAMPESKYLKFVMPHVEAASINLFTKE